MTNSPNMDVPLHRINLGDIAYPERVRTVMSRKAPKHLYMMGNKELLNLHSLGFCGSRKPSIKGLETAQDCAQQAASQGIVVISGNAAGIDSAAHFHSLKMGGQTIFVLPEGINHFKIRKIFSSVWDWDRVLVISQFEPDEPWKAFRAMARNQLIIALSQAMIVVEAGDTGGTLNAGLETLKTNVPLFVAEYRDMTHIAKGNKLLLEKGAQKFARNSGTLRANMDQIIGQISCNHSSMHTPIQGSFL